MFLFSFVFFTRFVFPLQILILNERIADFHSCRSWIRSCKKSMRDLMEFGGTLNGYARGNNGFEGNNRYCIVEQNVEVDFVDILPVIGVICFHLVNVLLSTCCSVRRKYNVSKISLKKLKKLILHRFLKCIHKRTVCRAATLNFKW